MNGTVWPNSVDLPLRIYSLWGSFFAYALVMDSASTWSCELPVSQTCLYV